MNVLVTGTSGHVGGAIAAHLVGSGWEVVGLSRRRSAVKGLAQHIQADLAAPSFVEGVRSALPHCDLIVHAAAALDRELTAPALSMTNCVGMQNVLALAKKWQVKNVVYLSGVAVVGTPRILPITEDHPAAPPTAYLASKLYGEHLLSIARRAGLVGSILRLTAPVGPGMQPNRILSVFVRNARTSKPLILAGQGSRRQNYVDMRDAAIAVEQCLRGGVEGLYNIGGAESISNLGLAYACVQTLGSSSPITFSGETDVEENITWDISIARAAKCFGYVPRYDIAASIRAVDSAQSERRSTVV